MFEIALPIVFTIWLWWFSTGAILFVDGLPRRTHPWSLGVATLLALAALAVIWQTAGETTTAAAYAAFVAVIIVWGWNELAFLTGAIVGSRREPCPPDVAGWRRFRLATSAIIDHEVAIALSAGAVALLTWGAPNQVALWTFAVLWVMRLSSKLNIFLGAPNIPEAFLPVHLRYLATYFRRRPMNALFPVSVTGATVVLVLMASNALEPSATPFQTLALILPASMLALAILEHWLMFLPIPSTLLWKWGLASHQREAGKIAGRDTTRLRSWEAPMTGAVDRQALQTVLDAIATGGFGQVVSLAGTSRSADGWIQFEVENGRTDLRPVAASRFRPAFVMAVGRDFDTEKLGKALAACAA
ncbi:putative photosynthetic complex assembly protein PuhE [Phreatobacter sp.]|uniref:putative photosynthetic complex assembly protein PuhE n=1 Tax=Phreatobacter sp. TaxID=1966341 RepID=UPI003F722E63